MFKRLADGFFKRTGFSLIELSVVLVVSSLMLGFGLQAVQSTGSVDCNGITKQQMLTIQGAVDKYVKAHSAYPRPAARGVSVTDPQFGRSVAYTAGAYTTIDSYDTGSSNRVLFGALPFQTLGLPASFAADCWGNKFSFNVAEKLTIDQTNYSNNAGIITIKTGAITAPATTTNQLVTDAAYAVISHGSDGSGAVKKSFSTATNTAAARGWQGTGDASVGSHIDAQNARVGHKIVYAAAFNNGKNAGANYFDDFVVYAEKGQTINADCPAQTLTWATNCSAPVAMMTNGQTPVATANTAAGYGGSAMATCANGVLTAASPSCSTSYDGVCDNTTALGCTTGTASNDDGNTGCGTTHNWQCDGFGVGSVADACSLVNPACQCTSAACGTTINGGTCTSYSATTAVSPATCASIATTSTCTGGSWNVTPSANGSCTVVTAGACNNGVALGCSTGTAISDNGLTACGTNRQWVCQSPDGGPNSGTCSIANAACITGVCNNATPLGCSTGTAISDNGLTACATTRQWVCQSPNGGANSGTCSYVNPCVSNGVCGGANNTCSTGTPSGYAAGTCGGNATWTCSGIGGGFAVSCCNSNAACIAGSCNNAVALGCNNGGASFNDGNQTACGTTHTWQCHSPNGGADSGACSFANAACPVNGVCDNTVALGCSAGSSTSDNGLTACGTTRQWVCAGANGGSNSGTCSKANAACAVPVNAVCGGGANTCSAGSPAGDYSAGACGGSQTWTCNGSNGGSNASCSIANAACPVNGVCAGSGTCSAGTPSADNGLTACGTTRTWNCDGSNGGSNASCTENNAACSTCDCSAPNDGTCCSSCGGNWWLDTSNGGWVCDGASGCASGTCNFINTCGEQQCVNNGNMRTDPYDAMCPGQRYQCNGATGIMTTMPTICGMFPPVCP